MDLLQTNKAGWGISGKKGLDYWSNLLLLLYILTMPFVSAFAYTDIITMPLVLAIFLFMVMMAKILQTGKLPEGFFGLDLVIVGLFIFLAVFSFVINGLGYSKALNHTAAYVMTLVLFYVAIKCTFFGAPDKDQLLIRILRFTTYTVIISAVYGNIEFVSANVFGLNLNNYVPRPTESEAFYNPTVLALFYRARGFATESGVYTQMLELLCPLSIYYMFYSGWCKWPRVVKILCTLSMVFSMIFAASTATFVILPIAIVLASLFYVRKIYQSLAKKSRAFHLRAVLIVLAIVIANSFLSLYETIFLSISEKLDSNSYYDRQDRIRFFFDQFHRFSWVNKLVGSGPGGSIVMGFRDTGSIISLFYNVTFELGLIGLFLLMCFIAYTLYHNIRIRTRIGWFLMVSLISGIIHYLAVNNYYMPWFWFVAAFTVFYSKVFVSK